MNRWQCTAGDAVQGTVGDDGLRYPWITPRQPFFLLVITGWDDG